MADEVQATGNPIDDVSHLEPDELKYHRALARQ